MELRPALPDDDAPGGHVLAGVRLDPAALSVRVAAVPRRALAFLMCHVPLVLLDRLSVGTVNIETTTGAGSPRGRPAPALNPQELFADPFHGHRSDRLQPWAPGRGFFVIR